MRLIAAVIALLVLLQMASLAQPPTNPGTPPPGGPPPGQGPGMRGGFAPPPFPGDTMAAERDSLMKDVMKRIEGREQAPAESVFKDIQFLKGRPAGSIPQIMNYGFGRALGVSCFHCHAKNDWAKDEKKQKRIAREMSKMVAAINTDYVGRIEGLGDEGQGGSGPGGPRKPTVNCATCHRGSIHTSDRGGQPRGGPGGGR